MPKLNPPNGQIICSKTIINVLEKNHKYCSDVLLPDFKKLPLLMVKSSKQKYSHQRIMTRMGQRIQEWTK